MAMGVEERVAKRRIVQISWNSRNRERILWVSARRRAAAKGREFSIKIEDIEIPEFCPVLGIPLDSHASIDRVDNSKGYIPGNIRVISYRANIVKGSGTLHEIESIARYMRDHIAENSE